MNINKIMYPAEPGPTTNCVVQFNINERRYTHFETKRSIGSDE